MPNPYDDEELFLKMQVGDRMSPGVVTLSGHDRERNWDVKASKGSDGGTSSLNGAPVGGFTATFYLVRDYRDGVDEFEEWDQFQAYLDSLTDGNKPKVVTVYHPDLARQKFTEVSIKKIYGIVYDSTGGGTAKVDFIEYRPPKPKKVKSPKDYPSDPAKAKPPDPNAAAKAELASLLEEAKRP